MKWTIMLSPLLLLACAQQTSSPTVSGNVVTQNKSYTGLQSTEQYAKDQSDLAQKEKMDRCIDAKSSLAKAQADKDEKAMQLLAAKVKSFCE